VKQDFVQQCLTGQLMCTREKCCRTRCYKQCFTSKMHQFA